MRASSSYKISRQRTRIQRYGELLRANYDMTPAEFSAELERAWKQLEPLYRELHDYVRARLIAKYGKAAERPDGMIPRNCWATCGAGVGQHL